ncbi:MAG: ATP-binding protein [Conexivisphaerales archaeon]
MELQDINTWWLDGHVKKEFIPPFKRDLFSELIRDFERRQIQTIVGLRRTGKSTLAFQLIDTLIRNGLNPRTILYCSFDEPELQHRKIEDILKEYSRLTRLDYKSEKIYLFLDEVQKANNWASSVKLVYDNFKNIKKIFLTGSASLNLMTEAKRELAGRALFYELKPMSFSEFLRFKGISISKEDADLYHEVLEREFDLYMFRQFPEIVREEDIGFIKNYIRNSVIEPIILKDIPKGFSDVDVMLLERLVDLLLSEPGQFLSVDEIAKELRRAKVTIYNAIFYLESSYIIRRVMNFRPSLRAASRKLAKVYAYHPILTIPFGISEERYAENLVCSELNCKYYWRERGKEIDFIAGSTPVEVKYSSKIDKSDLRWLRYFENRYGKAMGITKMYIVTKNLEDTSGNISLIPLWKFCFSGLV